MRISTFVVSLLLISGVSLAMFTLLVDLRDTYNPTLDPGPLNGTFASVQGTLINETGEAQNDIFAAEPTEENVLTLAGTGIVKATRGLFSAIEVFKDMVSTAIVATAGIIPGWAWGILTAVVSFLLVIALIYAFGGKDP